MGMEPGQRSAGTRLWVGFFSRRGIGITRRRSSRGLTDLMAGSGTCVRGFWQVDMLRKEAGAGEFR